MAENRLKVELELYVVGDGRTYLNFWSWKNGDDVVAEVKDGKLYMDVDDVDTEVSLQQFINEVKGKFKDE